MTFQYVSLVISVSLLTMSVILAFIRLVVGPSLPDRVVALDLMSTVGIGAIAAYSIGTQEAVFLDVASVLALVSFLGVVAFAYYMEKRGQAEELQKEGGDGNPSISEEGKT